MHAREVLSTYHDTVAAEKAVLTEGIVLPPSEALEHYAII